MWANEDPIPSTSAIAPKPIATKAKSPPDDGDQELTAGELDTRVSDLDWLKRHTKSSLDDAVPTHSQLYEQSDDDIEVDEDAEVSVNSLSFFRR